MRIFSRYFFYKIPTSLALSVVSSTTACLAVNQSTHCYVFQFMAEINHEGLSMEVGRKAFRVRLMPMLRP